MQTWRYIWCVYYFKHRLESAACLPAPSLSFHLFLHLLHAPPSSSLQYVYAFREESSGKIMEGKSL